MDLAYSKDEHEQVRNGYGSRIHDHEVRYRVSGRVRQKDIKEREAVNGSHRTSSSRSGSGVSGGGDRGPSRCGHLVKLADREPGELSSDGSGGAFESESLFNDSEVSKTENRTQSPLLTQKRKFSPIVWDRDDKEVRDSSKTRIVTASTIRPYAPSFAKSNRQSPNVVPDEALISPLELQPSLLKILDEHEHGFAEDALSYSPSNMPYSSPRERRWLKENEGEQVEDEDYIPARNISASRWAGDANSPADEGEISNPRKRSEIIFSKFQETRVNRRPSGPELWELKREGSDGAKTRSSDSERDMRSIPSSGDRGVENISDKEDHMELDVECNSNSAHLSRSDTYSDNENKSRENQSLYVLHKEQSICFRGAEVYRVSGRVRQKDIKEQEAVNGSHRTSSSRSGSGVSGCGGGGPSRCGHSVRLADRELGELSSDGSGGAFESESLFMIARSQRWRIGPNPLYLLGKGYFRP
ncbi:hypothetical protein Nepgr_022618 [Nepenthes gracilis]|uniref:Uncharacterized protein n=1 Tax=Nepenthes gracilis TaxID=150966 RepID=A0AAD3XYL0_NEPGR|nr:hypothetical protein Nepgr_022618 [Nepenthes gracilis]